MTSYFLPVCAQVAAAAADDCPDTDRFTRRVRQFRGRIDPDHEPTVTMGNDADGAAVATVELFGRHGVGQTLTLDAVDWRHVAATWGSQWVVSPGGGAGSFVVASGRHGANGGGRSKATLARLLTGVPRGGMVLYRDDNFRNLRRDNLVVLTMEKARAWRSARGVLARLQKRALRSVEKQN